MGNYEPRHVVEDMKLGVFLGMKGDTPIWSRQEGIKPAVAPTFANETEFKVAHWPLIQLSDTIRLQLVPLRHKGQKEATPEDCAAAGLHSW